MKFSLASDLHLHFGNIELKNSEEADVLILAGDTFEVAYLNNSKYAYVKDFFNHISDEFENILIISGNHEHYDSEYTETNRKFKDWLRENKLYNIEHLDKESVNIKNTWFHGCTLWTDLNKGDPTTKLHVNRAMNDYECIKGWSVSKQTYEHRKELEWLKQQLEKYKDSKNVVITHHHPSSRSLDKRYTDYWTEANFGYFSELSEYILDTPQITYWVAGHIHTQCEYEIGNTIIACNPRGYHGHEQIANEFTLRTYEL